MYSVVILEDFLYIIEKKEDETLEIVKYRIDIINEDGILGNVPHSIFFLQFQEHPLFGVGDTAHKNSFLFRYQ